MGDRRNQPPRFTARDVRGGLQRLVQQSKGRWGPSARPAAPAPQRPATAPREAIPVEPFGMVRRAHLDSDPRPQETST